MYPFLISAIIDGPAVNGVVPAAIRSRTSSAVSGSFLSRRYGISARMPCCGPAMAHSSQLAICSEKCSVRWFAALMFAQVRVLASVLMMRLRSGCAGSWCQWCSRRAYSTTVRARLSHIPIAIRRRSSRDLSGNARASCSSARRWPRRLGPTCRMIQAAASAHRSELVRRISRSIFTASLPPRPAARFSSRRPWT